jgi:hypothetical protein
MSASSASRGRVEQGVRARPAAPRPRRARPAPRLASAASTSSGWLRAPGPPHVFGVGRVAHGLAARPWLAMAMAYRRPACGSQRQWRRVSSTKAWASACSVGSCARSSPRELARRSPYSARGSGMAGVRPAEAAFVRGQRLHLLHRVLHQVLQRHAFVGDAVDERGVGAVLQQPPHQVGQQRVVAAHRRVDAAGPAQRCRQAVGSPAPPVRTAARPCRAGTGTRTARLPGGGVGHRVDGRQRVRVVGGELREHGVRRRQQPPRAGQVGHVGVGLARIDGVAVLAVELRALDLAVPVGALDQPHHQPAAAAPRPGRSAPPPPAGQRLL